MGVRLRHVIPVAAILGASCAPRLQQAAPVETRAGVRFVVSQPEATSVALAGTFNGWSTSSHPLERGGASGLWIAVVPLPPGEYLFMYVVDGVWVSPPAAEDYVDDGFGSNNGVVVVRPVRP